MDPISLGDPFIEIISYLLACSLDIYSAVKSIPLLKSVSKEWNKNIEKGKRRILRFLYSYFGDLDYLEGRNYIEIAENNIFPGERCVTWRSSLICKNMNRSKYKNIDFFLMKFCKQFSHISVTKNYLLLVADEEIFLYEEDIRDTSLIFSFRKDTISEHTEDCRWSLNETKFGPEILLVRNNNVILSFNVKTRYIKKDKSDIERQIFLKGFTSLGLYFDYEVFYRDFYEEDEVPYRIRELMFVGRNGDRHILPFEGRFCGLTEYFFISRKTVICLRSKKIVISEDFISFLIKADDRHSFILGVAK